MLVLSRKVNERILIDGDIRITVLGIRGNQVRLGIEAPGHVKVVREELIPLSELAEQDGEPADARPRAPLDLSTRRPRTPSF